MGFGWVGTFWLLGLTITFVTLLVLMVGFARRKQYWRMWLSIVGIAIISYPTVLIWVLAYWTYQILHGMGSFL